MVSGAAAHQQLDVNNYPRQFGANLAFGCNGCRLSTQTGGQTCKLPDRPDYKIKTRRVIDASFRDIRSHMCAISHKKAYFHPFWSLC